jgi:beta-galactosidase
LTGRRITIYGQREVVNGLMAARLRPHPVRSRRAALHRKQATHPHEEGAVHQGRKGSPGDGAAWKRRTSAEQSRGRSRLSVPLVAVTVALLALAVPSAAAAARTTVPLNAHWKFHLGDVPGAQAPGFDDRSWRTLSLPHTWNAFDAQDGPTIPFTPDYFRGVGWYRKTVTVPRGLRDGQLFLEFGGAGSVADVYVNGVLVGGHVGAFTRFRVDVTEALGDGGTIAVKVDNSARPDVAPLIGDFPIFGGLYRGVSLIATEATHLDLLDAGSPGVRIRQDQLTDSSATVEVASRVVNPDAAQVVTRIADARGDVVAQATSPAASTVVQTLDIANPHRWNGTDDPYLYSVRVSVVVDGEVVDRVTQPLGLRTITIDPAQGLLLNGRHYKVHGVNRHQDWLNRGWATSEAHVRRDFALMREMGVNALRTAHYPQDELVYDLADRYGILIYTEVPFVGVTFLGLGSNDSPQLTANLVSEAREMVRSLGNHPSIAWWGIGNEQGDKPHAHANLDAIQDTIKAEDPTRPTVYAGEAGADDANLTSPLTGHADLSAYNEYSGWYYHTPSNFGARLDALHATDPGRRIGISEYGAGASIYQHTEWPGTPAGSAQRPVPHPEEYQAYYHQQLWPQIEARDYLWGTFVWNMFDFASDFRNEGDRPGRNDKGLVTYDRKVRKDAFYYYKSAWTDTPTVHIVSKRWTRRTDAQTTIRVFSNAPSVTLKLNGMTRTAPVENYTAEFPVTLGRGTNKVIAVANAGTHDGVSDLAVWRLRPNQ